MKLTIIGNEEIASERLNFIISDLKANAQCQIELKVNYSWYMGGMYSSAAYQADERGTVDLSKEIPVKREYEIANSMGLFAILENEKGRFESKRDRDYTKEYILCTLSVRCDDEKVSRTIKRHFSQSDVSCVEPEELTGRYFYHVDKKRRNKILLLGGSEYSMNAISPLAASLTRNGSDVLLLDYSRGKKFVPIPIERVQEAIQWLKKEETDQLCVIGMSKGAELALFSASKFVGIDKVVAISPGEYIYQNPWSLGSSWKYQGRRVPYVHLWVLPILDFYKNLVFSFLGLPTGYLISYQLGTAMELFKRKKRIPVEEIDAEICLIAGGKDTVWQSKKSVMNIAQNRKDKNDKVYLYEKCGHVFDIPFVFGSNDNNGGNILDNMNAGEDVWKKVNDFLQG